MEKFYKFQKIFFIVPNQFAMSKKKITPKNEKNPLSQIFFAMSQNLHTIFKKFIKKIKYFGQIFKLWDTAKKTFFQIPVFGQK